MNGRNVPGAIRNEVWKKHCYEKGLPRYWTRGARFKFMFSYQSSFAIMARCSVTQTTMWFKKGKKETSTRPSRSDKWVFQGLLCLEDLLLTNSSKLEIRLLITSDLQNMVCSKEVVATETKMLTRWWNRLFCDCSHITKALRTCKYCLPAKQSTHWLYLSTQVLPITESINN